MPIRFMTLLAGIAIIMPCVAATNDLQELTGMITMAKAPYRFTLDGTTTAIQLEGNLPRLRIRTRLWVKGKLKTEFRAATTNPLAAAAWPDHWRVYMDVEECHHISKPFEKPKTKNSQNNSVDPISEPEPKRGSRKGSQ